MIKTFAFSILSVVGSTFACSLIDATYRTDTISAGTTQVVVTTWTTNFTTSPPTRVQTGQNIYGPYRQVDLETHLESALNDSSLVFIAQIDSLVFDSTVVLTPEIALSATTPDAGMAFGSFRARFQVDTLLRGTLPAKTFWVKTPLLNGAMCGTTWHPFLNKSFLNASNGLATPTDIKLPYSIWGFWNASYWFDGRYLVAPHFPGLRADITQFDPTFPATSIHTHGKVRVPMKAEGKAYLPDGRTAPSSSGTFRKSPVPLLK